MEEIIFNYFNQLSDNQKDKIVKLYSIYFDWNQKINTISRKEFDKFYTHHVLHSLSIAKFITFKKGTKILDLGTGGGFPAIPLAIMFPDIEIIAVDSIRKKIKVVDDVIAQLELDNIGTITDRVENIDIEVDFVVTRAVASLDKLVRWSRPLVHQISFNDKKNGLIALKGGDLKEEIKESGRRVKTINVSDFFEDDFFETKKIIYLPL